MTFDVWRWKLLNAKQRSLFKTAVVSSELEEGTSCRSVRQWPTYAYLMR